MCTCTFPAGFSICHCAGCHRNFSGVAAFDRHLTGSLAAHDHIDPPGHQVDDRGVWTSGDPATYRNRKAAAQLARRARHANVEGAGGGNES